MSGNQAKRWGPRYMMPAVNSVADNHDGYASLRGATPYALRRGGISMLRSEDAQSVAEQCGTSIEMHPQHYSYEIDDFSHLGPRSVDEQWRTARAAVRAALEEDAGPRRGLTGTPLRFAESGRRFCRLGSAACRPLRSSARHQGARLH